MVCKTRELVWERGECPNCGFTGVTYDMITDKVFCNKCGEEGFGDDYFRFLRGISKSFMTKEIPGFGFMLIKDDHVQRVSEGYING